MGTSACQTCTRWNVLTCSVPGAAPSLSRGIRLEPRQIKLKDSSANQVIQVLALEYKLFNQRPLNTDTLYVSSASALLLSRTARCSPHFASQPLLRARIGSTQAVLNLLRNAELLSATLSRKGYAHATASTVRMRIPLPLEKQAKNAYGMHTLINAPFSPHSSQRHTSAGIPAPTRPWLWLGCSSCAHSPAHALHSTAGSRTAFHCRCIYNRS